MDTMSEATPPDPSVQQLICTTEGEEVKGFLPPAGSQDISSRHHTRYQRLALWSQSTTASIYLGHFLSAWGDRMWMFAVGMYLADLSPGNLRLVASFGFSVGAAAVLMGAVIGDIVDRYPRLIVARTVLSGQNLAVALCAVLVCMMYQFKTVIYSREWSSGLCEASIIVLAVIAYLFSTAHKISVEKDWVSVICEGNSAKLAKLSSIMRAIDQFAIIAAPILSGLLMSYGSMMISALFVAIWNICSVFAEYALLLRIYNRVPALAVKMAGRRSQPKTSDVADISVAEKECLTVEGFEGSPNPPTRDQQDARTQSRCLLCCTKTFTVFIALRRGWSTYFSYEAKFAGFGLALVYMTVLGFDNITVGYAYYQGASQAVLGGLMSLGALTGIAATFTYPIMRKRLGVERTGLLGFWAEIIALSLCVFSIWAPGSPFDLSVPFFPSQDNRTHYTELPTSPSIMGSTNGTTQIEPTSLSIMRSTNGTMQIEPTSLSIMRSTNGTTQIETDANFTSLTLLMAGIIAARYGLWTLDLSISQILLERIEPAQRGVVNGVQGSLNMIMDMLKFVLVIVVPSPEHFGILIILSYLAICLGGVSYALYSYRVRGHLFHFNKLLLCCHTCNTEHPTSRGSPGPALRSPSDDGSL